MARQPKGLLPTRKHRDYTGRIVTGCLAVIAFAMFMGWYLREGLTPEQIELLKARRDAMALSVAEPPPNKKKWWFIENGVAVGGVIARASTAWPYVQCLQRTGLE